MDSIWRKTEKEGKVFVKKTALILNLVVSLAGCDFAYAETKIISQDLQYWIVFRSSLTPANLQKAKNYGRRNWNEPFWNLNIIPCNTNYFMASLLPNATEQTALDAVEATGKGYCYRKRHYTETNGSIGVESVGVRPLPIDWDKDWTKVEITTP